LVGFSSFWQHVSAVKQVQGGGFFEVGTADEFFRKRAQPAQLTVWRTSLTQHEARIRQFDCRNQTDVGPKIPAEARFCTYGSPSR
jgi:hypothetical protein